MKKIGALILFILLVACTNPVELLAETFTETDIGGDTVDGTYRVCATQARVTDESGTTSGYIVEAGYITYDNTNPGFSRIRTEDITSEYNSGQLTAIEAILSTGLGGMKAAANIPE